MSFLQNYPKNASDAHIPTPSGTDMGVGPLWSASRSSVRGAR